LYDNGILLVPGDKFVTTAQCAFQLACARYHLDP
jgi:hypothetical protein